MLQNIHIYAPHKAFFSLVPLACAIILLLAAAIRRLIPGLSIGYLSILIWAWVIAGSYFSDFLSLPLFGCCLVVAAPILTGAILGLVRKKDSLLALTTVGQLLGYYICWLVGIGVLLIPLVFFVPPDTVIPGRHVCNDIVSHALVAKGRDHFLGTGLDLQLFNWYPRGFHAVLYYLVQLIGFSQLKLIFPLLIFSYSFIIPFVFDVASALSIRSFWQKFGLTILACSPFLGISALYQGFAAQLTVIPIVLLVLFRTFSPPIIPISISVFNFAFLCFTAVTAYTIFPLTLIGLGICIGGSSLLIERRLLVEIKTLISAFSVKLAIALVALTLFSIPSTLAAAKFLFLQATGDSQAGDILRSSGNLTGYLSPLHLSGFWPKEVYHASSPINASAWFAYLQIAMIGLIVTVLAKSSLKKEYWLVLLTLFVPVFLIPIVGPTEYIQFKYLTLSAPALFLFTGVAFLHFKESIFRNILLGLFVVTCFSAGVIYSGRIVGQWPVLAEPEFERYVMYRKKYFSKGGVVVLTQDGYFRYFKNRKSVYIPFTGNYPTPYLGQSLNYIFVDKIASGSNNDFLARHPELKTITDNQDLLVYSDDRVSIFKFK